MVGANLAKGMGPITNYKDLILNVLRFMHQSVVFQDKAKEPKSRDAAEWGGAVVLAEGNYNGCVEAAKLFLELFREAAKQTGFSGVEANYISSFDMSWATAENLRSGNAPSGHALVEIKQSGAVLLVDASSMDCEAYDDPNLTSSELETHSFIKYSDNSGTYFMNAPEKKEPFRLFGKRSIPTGQENKDNLFDPTTSNGMTRNAIRDYLSKTR